MARGYRILVVDDDPYYRETVESILVPLGYDVLPALNGRDAISKLGPGIDLVLSDLEMPVVDGYALAQFVRKHPQCADIPFIMLTSTDDRIARLKAIEAGANDFITKPVDKLELRVRMEAQLAMKRSRDALEETVKARTSTLRRALQTVVESQKKTNAAYLETIHRLALAAEFKDQNTAAHIQRVGHYSAMLARSINLPKDEVEIIFRASPMHDVGKLGVPDDILRKPGKLTEDEWKIMRDHTVIGAKLLGGSGSELLQAGEVIAISHHEKWDGTGYPYGIAGERIPLYGRICAVADVYDALCSRRAYKEAFDEAKVIDTMRDLRGTHFDPILVDALMANQEEARLIKQRYSDENVCPAKMAA